eukprot:SAG31_NODE_12005_length_978_cov_1.379977_1_plen_211_part_10
MEEGAVDGCGCELQEWLETAAGLSGRKLERALAICLDTDVEEVDDLSQLQRSGKLGNQGFSDVVLLKIEAALSAGPGPEPEPEPSGSPTPAAAQMDADLAMAMQLQAQFDQETGGIPSPEVPGLDAITQTVRQLANGDFRSKEKAAEALWRLAANNADNQVAIAQAGAVAPLVRLLTEGSAGAQENAAAVLTYLAANNADNKVAIAQAGAV